MGIAMRQDESITVREIDGEILVLDMGSNQVHQLNRTASFVWNRCAEGLAPDAIAVAFAREFEVDDETARRDVDDTLGKLGALKLLDVS